VITQGSTGAGALERPAQHQKSTTPYSDRTVRVRHFLAIGWVWHLRSQPGSWDPAAWLTMDMWAAHPKPRRPCIFLWPVHVTSREPVVFRMTFGRGHVSIASSNPHAATFTRIVITRTTHTRVASSRLNSWPSAPALTPPNPHRFTTRSVHAAVRGVCVEGAALLITRKGLFPSASCCTCCMCIFELTG